MKVRIYVTQEDIRLGYLYSFSCPIYRAAARILPPTLIHLQVLIDILGYRNNKEVKLPIEASLFVDNFDHGRPVIPFDFLVEI